jgi:hypothetical protein|uniref:Uncharacterized protein n=1 Tax=Raoultella ornithinolytica TaxID=54291 RepID=A0A4D6FXP1_RAOOR|nr:hypothetical protein [Raoultella ornithinolytica]UUW41762.1 hypothetical protein [Klebsiella michiganensis]
MMAGGISKQQWNKGLVSLLANFSYPDLTDSSRGITIK